MIQLLEEYTKLSNKIDELFCQAEELDQQREEVLEKLEESVDETKLRRTLPSDVKPGQIVFGKGSNGWFVREIYEVLNPKDDFKAWVCNDGCRYGLSNSYVLL